MGTVLDRMCMGIITIYMWWCNATYWAGLIDFFGGPWGAMLMFVLLTGCLWQWSKIRYEGVEEPEGFAEMMNARGWDFRPTARPLPSRKP